MAKIDVYRCDHTHQIFYGTDDYRFHLREMARVRMKMRERDQAKAKLAEEVKILHRSSNVKDIEQWIIDHVDLLRVANSREENYKRYEYIREEKEPFEFGGIEIRKLRWNPYLDRHPDWPELVAEVVYNIKGYPPFDLFRNIGIELGTGTGNCITGWHHQEMNFRSEVWPSLAVMKRIKESA